MNDSIYTTMESLELPTELIWDGKSEPSTPPSNELFENWLFSDNFANEIPIELTVDEDDVKPCDFELIDGDDIVIRMCDIKEDTWNHLEIEASSPKLLSAVSLTTTPTAELYEYTAIYGTEPAAQLVKVQNDNFMETNFNDAAVLSTLTPPDSPNHNVTTLITSLQTNDNIYDIPQQPVISALSSPTVSKQETPEVILPTPTTSTNLLVDDIARDVQIVDDIVKIRVQELSDYNDDCDSMSSYSQNADSITDEEWPASSYASSSSSSSASSSPVRFSNDEQIKTSSTTSQKKRTRPYGRGVEDRKIRKKEQNKNAATRYRQKKKIEMENVLTEEQELVKVNEDLKRTLIERKREAKYLRNLLREFYQDKFGKK